MIYADLTIGEKELKLRLDARNCVSLEKKLGKSPLDIFMDGDDSLPKLEELITVLQASLQKYESGYTVEKTYDLYDDYIEAGNTFTDFIPVIMNIFEISGFFKKGDLEKAKAEEEKKQIAVVE